MKRHLSITAAASALVATTAAAQQPAAQPPIRPLGAVTARSSDSIATVAGLRALSNGHVLVNDRARRRVVLYDENMKPVKVVADSTPATGNAYSGQVGGLVAYKGDSTLFVDPISLSMLLLDPSGKVARVMSVPRSQDAMQLASLLGGTPGFDAKGRLVYRGNNRIMPTPPPAGQQLTQEQMMARMMPQSVDSAPVLRVDLATRQLDTAAFIKVPNPKMNMSRSEEAGSGVRVTMTQEINPLPLTDEWAVMADGSIALVRGGRDYRMDVLKADGTVAQGTKIPFDWQRLSDEDKVALIDSVKTIRERMRQSGQTMMANGQTTNVQVGTPPGGAAGAARAGAEGGTRMTIMMGADGGAPPMRGGAAGAAAMHMPALTYVSPSELPDYKPPFLAGAVRADMDGNVWVRTVPTRQIPGGPVYDVLNAKGELVDRVQVPANRSISGFGPGGVVYLLGIENGQTVLERAKAK